MGLSSSLHKGSVALVTFTSHIRPPVWALDVAWSPLPPPPVDELSSRKDNLPTHSGQIFGAESVSPHVCNTTGLKTKTEAGHSVQHSHKVGGLGEGGAVPGAGVVGRRSS